jgi:CO/xanthine dehydrogenase FAD-binding subunit
MKRTEPFDFYQPTTLEEASRLLKDNGPGGRLLAGGTDLVIALKEKGLLPKYLVDLKRVPGLTGIRENSDGSITIGALATMREIETSPLITKKFHFWLKARRKLAPFKSETAPPSAATWRMRLLPPTRLPL